MLLVYGVVMPFTVARLLPAELNALLQPFIPPRFLLYRYLTPEVEASHN